MATITEINESSDEQIYRNEDIVDTISPLRKRTTKLLNERGLRYIPLTKNTVYAMENLGLIEGVYSSECPVLPLSEPKDFVIKNPRLIHLGKKHVLQVCINLLKRIVDHGLITYLFCKNRNEESVQMFKKKLFQGIIINPYCGKQYKMKPIERTLMKHRFTSCFPDFKRLFEPEIQGKFLAYAVGSMGIAHVIWPEVFTYGNIGMLGVVGLASMVNETSIMKTAKGLSKKLKLLARAGSGDFVSAVGCFIEAAYEKVKELMAPFINCNMISSVLLHVCVGYLIYKAIQAGGFALNLISTYFIAKGYKVSSTDFIEFQAGGTLPVILLITGMLSGYDMNSFSRYYRTVSSVVNDSATEFDGVVKNCLNAISGYLWGVPMFNMDALEKSLNELKELTEELETHMEYKKFITTDPDLPTRLFRAVKESYVLAKTASNAKGSRILLTDIKSMQAKLLKHWQKVLSSNYRYTNRKGAVIFLLAGHPGCGKDTVLKTVITAANAKAFGKDLEAKDYFCRGTGDFGFEGYSGQEVCIYNELGATHDATANGTQILELLSCTGKDPMPLNTAFEDKGTSYFTSTCVGITTNRVDMEGMNMYCTEAFYRRCGVPLWMKRKQNYKGKDPSEWADCWEFSPWQAYLDKPEEFTGVHRYIANKTENGTKYATFDILEVITMYSELLKEAKEGTNLFEEVKGVNWDDICGDLEIQSLSIPDFITLDQTPKKVRYFVTEDGDPLTYRDFMVKGEELASEKEEQLLLHIEDGQHNYYKLKYSQDYYYYKVLGALLVIDCPTKSTEPDVFVAFPRHITARRAAKHGFLLTEKVHGYYNKFPENGELEKMLVDRNLVRYFMNERVAMKWEDFKTSGPLNKKFSSESSESQEDGPTTYEKIQEMVAKGSKLAKGVIMPEASVEEIVDKAYTFQNAFPVYVNIFKYFTIASFAVTLTGIGFAVHGIYKALTGNDIETQSDKKYQYRSALSRAKGGSKGIVIQSEAVPDVTFNKILDQVFSLEIQGNGCTYHTTATFLYPKLFACNAHSISGTNKVLLFKRADGSDFLTIWPHDYQIEKICEDVAYVSVFPNTKRRIDVKDIRNLVCKADDIEQIMNGKVNSHSFRIDPRNEVEFTDCGMIDCIKRVPIPNAMDTNQTSQATLLCFPNGTNTRMGHCGTPYAISHETLQHRRVFGIHTALGTHVMVSPLVVEDIPNIEYREIVDPPNLPKMEEPVFIKVQSGFQKKVSWAPKGTQAVGTLIKKNFKKARTDYTVSRLYRPDMPDLQLEKDIAMSGARKIRGISLKNFQYKYDLVGQYGYVHLLEKIRDKDPRVFLEGFHFDFPKKCRPLTISEMFIGCPEQGVDGVDLNSSAGPLNVRGLVGDGTFKKKKDLFRVTETGEVQVAQHVLEDYNAYVKVCREGKTVRGMFEDLDKDEVRKMKQIEIKGQALSLPVARRFYNASCSMQMATRKWFSPILSHVKKHCCFQGDAVGVNPHCGHFQMLYKRLRKLPYLAMGDVKGNDFSTQATVMEDLIDMVRIAHNVTSKEDLSEIRGIIEGIAHAYHIVDDDMYLTYGGIASGLTPTTLVNGTGLHSTLVQGYYLCVMTYFDDINAYVKYPFKDHIRLVTSGDDFCYSFSEEVRPAVNFKRMVEIVHRYLGLRLTPIRKDEGPQEHYPWSDFELIQRTPRVETINGTNYYHGVLNKDSILKALYFEKKSKSEAPNVVIRSVLEVSALEMMHHGKEEFDWFVDNFKDNYEELTGNEWPCGTYQYYHDRWVENYRVCCTAKHEYDYSFLLER